MTNNKYKGYRVVSGKNVNQDILKLLAMGIYRKAYDYDSERDTEKSNKINNINFTFPIIKFNDDILKNIDIKHGSIHDVFTNMSDNEALLNYDSLEDYLIHRFIKLNENIPNVLRIVEGCIYYEKFIDKFFSNLKINCKSIYEFIEN